jgi:hypothetical protein
VQRRGLLKPNQEGKLEVPARMNRDYRHHGLVFLVELVVSQLLKKFPAFMEPENSLPCSQEPTTGPYLEVEFDVPLLNVRGKAIE